MEIPLLVDSNIYIHLLRRRLDPAAALFEHFDTLNLATCGMVKLEVVRGLREPRLRERIEQFMRVMLFVPTDNGLWEETIQLGWEMDRRGNTIPAQDILIAASALRLGADVLTLDHHFSVVPGLRVRTLPDSLLL